MAWKNPSPGVRHALAWATVIVGFFSFSQTKIPTYVLGAFPPLLALTAVYVDDVLARRVEMPRALEFAAVGWTVLAAAIAVGGAVWIIIDAPPDRADDAGMLLADLALAQQDPALGTAVKLLSRPVAAALVVTVILNELLNLETMVIPWLWIKDLA